MSLMFYYEKSTKSKTTTDQRALNYEPLNLFLINWYSISNIWNNWHGFRYSRSTQNHPKMQTASILVLRYSTKTLMSKRQLSLQDIGPIFASYVLGYHQVLPKQLASDYFHFSILKTPYESTCTLFIHEKEYYMALFPHQLCCSMHRIATFWNSIKLMIIQKKVVLRKKCFYDHTSRIR